jgi:hypothetical protein
MFGSHAPFFDVHDERTLPHKNGSTGPDGPEHEKLLYWIPVIPHVVAEHDENFSLSHPYIIMINIIAKTSKVQIKKIFGFIY